MALRLGEGVIVLKADIMRIGAIFRREAFAHVADTGTLMLQHMGNHMIRADENAIFLDLRLEMPVADMPGKGNEGDRLGGGDFDQVLAGSLDFHLRSVVQQKTVAIGQLHRLFQIDKHMAAIVQLQTFAADMPVLRVEGDAVLGWPLRRGGLDVGDCFQCHDQNRKYL